MIMTYDWFFDFEKASQAGCTCMGWLHGHHDIYCLHRVERVPAPAAAKFEAKVDPPWKCGGGINLGGARPPCSTPSAPRYLETLTCVVCYDKYAASMMTSSWRPKFTADVIPPMPVSKVRPEYLRHDWRDPEWMP